MTKTCGKCSRELPMNNDYFEKRTQSKDGFRGVCRECRGKSFKIKKEEQQVPKDHKMCSKCKQIKELNETNFKNSNRNIDGWSNTCTECRLSKKKTYVDEFNKRCEKCGQILPKTEEYFKKDNLCLDGFRNICHECCGSYYGERRKYSEWSDEDIKILKENYPYMSNEDLFNTYFSDKSLDTIQSYARDFNLQKDAHSMKERYWTDKEEELLIKLYPTTNTKELENIFNKTDKTITARAIKLGVSKEEVWSEDEIIILKENYPYMKTIDMIGLFKDKNISTIDNKVRNLNLKKDEKYKHHIQTITALKNVKKAQIVIIDGIEHKRAGKYHSAYVERLTLNCIYCGKEIYRLESHIKNNNNTFCSLQCSAKWKSENMSGENSPVFGKISALWTEEMRRNKAKQQIEYLKATDFSYSMTKPQLITNNLLDSMNIQYTNEYDCKYYLVDNYLTESNLMIEVQGNFFHCNPTMNCKNSREIKIKAKDKSKHTYIKKYHSIEVLYLWEYDIENNLDVCKKLIEKYINNNGILNDYHSFNYYLENDELIELENKYTIGY